MSVGISAGGQYVRRTANLPSPIAYTIYGWAMVRSIRAAQYQYIAGLEDALTNAPNWSQIGYNNSGQFMITVAAGEATFASNPTLNSWFFWALTCSGTGANSFNGYYAHFGNTFTTVSRAGASFTPALMAFGNDSWDEYIDGILAAVKVYDAALTADELYAEMYRVSPARLHSLNLWSKLANSGDLLDYSGNGRNLTSGGTLTTETNPPISDIFIPYLVSVGSGIKTFATNCVLASVVSNPIAVVSRPISTTVGLTSGVNPLTLLNQRRLNSNVSLNSAVSSPISTVTRPIASNIGLTSATQSTVTVNRPVSTTVALTSNTQSSAQILRPIVSNTSLTSVTGAIGLSKLIALLTNISLSSLTIASMVVNRTLNNSVALTSSTSNPTLLSILTLIANVVLSSTTSGAMSVLRRISSNVGLSSTTNSTLNVLRQLLASTGLSSNTNAISLFTQLAIYFQASVALLSSTSSSLVVTRSLTANESLSSTTQSTLQVLRHLTANLSLTSTTSSSSLITGLLFQCSVVLSSITGSSISVQRSLNANSTLTSNASSALSVLRSLTTNVVATTTTSLINLTTSLVAIVSAVLRVTGLQARIDAHAHSAEIHTKRIQ